MKEHLEENEKNVIAFYDPMFNQCKPAEAIEKFTGDVYIQHNPAVADGKEAFIEYFRAWKRTIPENVLTSNAALPRETMSFSIFIRSGRVIATGPDRHFSLG
jgi:predicted SnoaL-like aldol condensation-catalyzing enzyme